MTIKLWAFLILAILIAVGITYFSVHERHQGAEVCETQDKEAAKKELDRYKEQLSDAMEKLADANRLLALAANSPVTPLVCRQTRSKPVTQKGDSQPSSAGIPNNVQQPDFDPTTDLRNLFAGYEGRVEVARDALNRCPGR
jgi:hypothetical protein